MYSIQYIDQRIMKDGKTKRKKYSYGADWLQKSHEMVSQRWKIDCRKMYKISDEIFKLIEEIMKNWWV